jgi:ADP-ribose pyrophosphatase YjhB (NUDIX family)
MNAVGVWFYCRTTNRSLYLMRNGARHAMTWGLPGGKSRTGEVLLETVTRECQEEMGSEFEFGKIFPVEKFISADSQFVYHTFFCCVDQEFLPKLNEEHIGYAWIAHGTWPRPMHPGLWNTVNLEVVMRKIDIIVESNSDIAERYKFSKIH